MECTVRNIKIYYEVYGEGVPVLMIHGWGPDHRLMKGCMEPVFTTMDTAWKRIYFDLPGMGKTKGEPWITGSDQMLDIILDFIDQIIPNQKFLVAGESYGGYLARGILHKRPLAVDGLLLICPSVILETPVEETVRYQVLEKDGALFESLTEDEKTSFEFEGVNAIQNRRVWERYKEEVIPGLMAADQSFLENCLGQKVPFSFNAKTLEKPYEKPALILTGRQDSMVGYRNMWQIIDLFPRASFALLDKAGHGLQIEQDVLFTALVKEWLDRVTAEQINPHTL